MINYLQLIPLLLTSYAHFFHTQPCGTGALELDGKAATARAEIFKKVLKIFFGESLPQVGAPVEYPGQYLCAQLRLAGSEWEKESVYTQLRDKNFKAVKDFLLANDKDGIYPLYVSTDNEKVVLESQICSQRECLFASDFKDILNKHGLKHFQQLGPLDYLVCSNADHVEVSEWSSFGYYISELHKSITAVKIEADDEEEDVVSAKQAIKLKNLNAVAKMSKEEEIAAYNALVPCPSISSRRLTARTMAKHQPASLQPIWDSDSASSPASSSVPWEVNSSDSDSSSSESSSSGSHSSSSAPSISKSPSENVRW